MIELNKYGDILGENNILFEDSKITKIGNGTKIEFEYSKINNILVSEDYIYIFFGNSIIIPLNKISTSKEEIINAKLRYVVNKKEHVYDIVIENPNNQQVDIDANADTTFDNEEVITE
jgi:hypothetical protein